VEPITGEQSMAVDSKDKPINGLLLEPGFYVSAKIVEVFLSGM
jgi:predicted nucleic acid-binding protein